MQIVFAYFFNPHYLGESVVAFVGLDERVAIAFGDLDITFALSAHKDNVLAFCTRVLD
ncbi:hypothetical protein [Synechococcus sp. MIT S1220]|uniref:hypothetical protein n=1 Tax=Synechococcus sp. MIT S1220 TaxID=3082549 RepID=UPI0039B00184